MKVKILYLEDNPYDVEIFIRHLKDAPFNCHLKYVNDEASFKQALKEFKPDVIISDFKLPAFDGVTALTISQTVCPDVPFIFISGTVGEDVAVTTLKLGATDYILKSYPEKILPAISRALQEKKERQSRIEAEKALRESEAKYRLLFEKSLAAVFSSKMDGTLLEVNQAYADMLGYESPAEMKKYNAKEFYTSPEEREKFIQVLKVSDEVKNFELKLKKKSGEIINVIENVGIIKNTENNEQIIHGTLFEVTELRKAEIAVKKSNERFKLITKATNDAIWDWNIEANEAWWNDTFYKLFGFNPEETKPTYENWLSIIHPEDRERVAKGFLEEVNSNSDSWSDEFRCKLADGSYGYFLDRGYILRDASGKAVRMLGAMMDLTDRKKFEEKIKMLARSLESISECVSITDVNNIILYVNDSFLKTYGYEEYELIGKHVSVLQPDTLESKGIQKEILEHTLKGGWKGEIINKRKDGSEFPVYISTSIVKDSDNKPIALIGVATDITSQKKAERERKEREASLKEAQTIAKMGDWEFDVINKKAVWSENCYAIYGLKPFEIVPTYEYFISRVHHDDIHLIDEAYKKILDNREPQEFELRITFPDGNYKWILNKMVPVFEGDTLTKLKGINIDITERKIAEEKIRESELLFYTLAQSSPVGIFRTRADGYTTYVNPKWSQLSGLSFEAALGDGWLKAVHPDDREKIAKEWEDALKNKRQSNVEYRFLTAGNKVIWVMGQAIPELDSNNQVKGYVGTITDITKIKLFEHELIAAKEKAEQTDKLKSEFLAQMSHEIRTPLNVILSFGNFLKNEIKGLIDEDTLATFSVFDSAGKRIIRTIDLILNMSELQTGMYQYSPKEFDLHNDVLLELYSDFKSQAESKNLEFSLLQKIKCTRVYADEYSTKQIFSNLIDNAIKYTPKGSVTVSVDRNDDKNVLVQITDTGIGMSEEYLQKLFEPFSQEEQGYTRKFEGTGLGLALVKKYCEINKIEIAVESKKGKGTTFSLVFQNNQQSQYPIFMEE